MMGGQLTQLAASLAESREAYVSALVVRVERPSSVSPGDAAIVRADGSVQGFVGGACAETSLRLHAARVLETGEPLLLRILPGEGDGPASEGSVTVHNPCLSGGGLEIFLEPVLPSPRLVVIGETPIARALVELGAATGLHAELSVEGPDAVAEGDAALVVASHGRMEDGALRRALEAGVPYVGLVASRKRGAAVLEELRGGGVREADVARVHTPAGLDIGAHGPREIALSILAEIVQERSSQPMAPAKPSPTTATDPVCGMTVSAAEPSPFLDHDGGRVWFCCDGCRSTFERDPAAHAAP